MDLIAIKIQFSGTSHSKVTSKQISDVSQSIITSNQVFKIFVIFIGPDLFQWRNLEEKKSFVTANQIIALFQKPYLIQGDI